MNIPNFNALKWPYGHYYIYRKNGANLTSRDRYIRYIFYLSTHKSFYTSNASYIDLSRSPYCLFTGIQIVFQINVPSKTPLWNNRFFQQLSPATISVWPLVIQDGLRWGFYIHSWYSLIKTANFHQNIIYVIQVWQILLHYNLC